MLQFVRNRFKSDLTRLGKLKALLLTRLKYLKRTVTISDSARNFRLRIHSPYEENLFLNHEEKPLLDLLCDKLRPDDVIYDIGAHAGYHAVFLASALGPGGQVLAFEPNPNCFKYLKENIELNRDLNIEPYSMAVSDKCGTINLYFGEAYDRSARLRGGFGPNMAEVETCCIDEFVQTNPTPTVIKIDVEGSEDLVIHGSLNSIKEKSMRIILLELHPDMLIGGDETAIRLRQTILGCGFVETFIQPRRQQLHILYEKDI